jgi:hypothetical protein
MIYHTKRPSGMNYGISWNRDYGSFQKDTEHGVIACIVQDTLCRSEAEWDNLIKPYMDE